MRCFHCMNNIPDGAAFCPYCNEAPLKENPPYCLTAGTVLKNKYIIGNVIGEGGFGITYAGWDSALGQRIAVKEYYPSICANRSHTGDNQVIPGQASKGQYFRMGKERFTQEAQSASQFSGEAGIVKILDYFEENDTAYIVMNYVEGGNLGEIVRSRGKFEPKTFFAVMLPLMRTLEHVHQTGMIHRDIAPDNIIMSQDGSLTGAWTDVYALCATIYKCITGETPPDALDRAINDELKKPSELGVRLPAAIETALMKGLAIFPKDRLQTVGELRKAVEKGYPITTSPPVSSRRIKLIAVTTISLTIILLGIVLVVATPHFAENNQEILKKPTDQSHSSENSSSTSESSEIQKTSNEQTTVAPTINPNVDLTSEIDAASKEEKTFSIGNHFFAYIDKNGQAHQFEINGSNVKEIPYDISDNYDLVAMEYSPYASGTGFGIKEDGSVIVLSNGSSGRYNYLEALPFLKNVKDIVSYEMESTKKDGEESNWAWIFALHKDGTVISVVLRDKDGKVGYLPDYDSWENIKSITIDFSQPLGLKSDGTLVENKDGKPTQVGNYKNIAAVPQGFMNPVFGVYLNKNGTVECNNDLDPDEISPISFWTDIISIADSDNTIGLKKDGTVIAEGSNEQGQCNVSDWKNIVAIQTNENFTVGKRTDGTFVLATNDTTLAKNFDKTVNGK